MQDAWRSYLALAMGLTEAPRRKAQETARRLVGTGGATAVQLQAFAEELVSTSAANRAALTKLVRFEVERALGAVGLATADEVTELTRRVRELERQLREAPHGSPVALAAGGTVAAVDAEQPIAPGSAAEPAVVKKTVAKQAVVKQAVVKKRVAKEVAPGKPVAARPATEMSAAPRSVKRAPRKQQPGGPE
ncbi:phasin family protein [Salinispora mooreana]|uniref:phasin family protein n=1 Tax=Salinispora mooreana TaxID=999545 RepID=UPI00036AA2D4|nr:hypothetical protein [Salinispora mooreana]